MTVNGRTEDVKSAIYAEVPSEELGENGVMLYLLKDVVTGIPENEPDFAIAIVITESLYGKTIDLTKPVPLNSVLSLIGITQKTEIGIYYSGGTITDDDENEITVSGGTLLLTRSGDNFTVKLSVTLSDGNSLAADWKGKATKVEIPD